MAFEVFDKRQAPLAKAPAVTIQKRGLMSLNRAAFSLIGNPSTVELLYDRESDVVGIRPAADNVPHAYSVRLGKDTGPVMVAGTAFCQFYRIDTTTSRRWTPTVADGVLCVDLRKQGVEIVGNRAARASKGATGTMSGDVD